MADVFYPCGGIVIDPVKSTEALVRSRAKETGLPQYDCAAALALFLGKEPIDRWMADHGFGERWAEESGRDPD